MRAESISASAVKRFWAQVEQSAPDECWEWQGPRSLARKWHYGRFGLKKKRYPAHRIAYLLTHGEVPDDLFVCHTCDNPPCCNPQHLFLGTATDNAADRHVKGREPRGDAHPNSALTAEQRELAIELFSTGQVTYAMLASYFGGVCRQTICNAVRGRNRQTGVSVTCSVCGIAYERRIMPRADKRQYCDNCAPSSSRRYRGLK